MKSAPSDISALDESRSSGTLLRLAILLGLAAAWAALFFVVLSPDHLSATAVRIRKEPKPKKKAPCCRMGIAYRSGPGMVVLDRICATKKKTVVHLRTVRLRSVCTFPPATIIRDEKRRRYSMIAHTGLPNCKKGTSQRLYQRFTWTFRPLRRGVKRITVIELSANETAGMSYWAWRNVKIDHCRFKF